MPILFIFIYFAHSRVYYKTLWNSLFFVRHDFEDKAINSLELTTIRRTRDMSVANVIRTTAFFPYREIAKQLLKVLIDRGDKELEILHDEISVDSKFEDIRELIDSLE